MPTFLLACLAYVTVALPGSTLGLLWPSMRLSFHEPLGALGILLAFGVTASVVSSTVTGRILARTGVGQLLAIGTVVSAVALTLEAFAPSLAVVAIGFVLFGLGFGSTDSALNAHAASYFGPRQISWMHASYGLGATTGPLLVTALLANGLTWRWAYGIIGALLAALAGVFIVTRGRWDAHARSVASAIADPEPDPDPGENLSKARKATARRKRPFTVTVTALSFVAVETGIESGAGIWGYIFLTAGRGLSHEIAGVVVSAYWAMMFLGRAVFGAVAERVGAARVLRGAVLCLPLGAVLMSLPGPGFVGVVGMLTIGLAAAPIFPLFTLSTSQRVGAGDVIGIMRTVSFQVAASAVGAAALPAGIGVVIAASNPRALAPLLLVFGLAMCGVHGLLSSWSRTAKA